MKGSPLSGKQFDFLAARHLSPRTEGSFICQGTYQEESMEEQTGTTERDTTVSYEPPALIAVGEFSEDTLGFGTRHNDVLGEQGW
ncbi:hypothetical protein GCM10012286_44310 [Streptomyces lasiicapitis]|uniref:Lasso RiPP family leader peptide-containing protein n=1 Tax=Streptomyces lasiicapitis TaxID=1923961 RepID=A0ABQ2M9X8_9ACTN|nr:hypothetical protein GCM10012286_44310 [Streptomyces lasiicapitis]